MTEPVDRLADRGILQREELVDLLRYRNPETTEYLMEKAMAARSRYFDQKVELWGRIPFTSYCKNDCKYCGLRRSNQFAPRFRLAEREVLQYCEEGYRHGIRHFLLEGGVDLSYAENDVAHLIGMLRRKFQDAELILALGEHTDTAYRHWMQAGAGIYLMHQDSCDDAQFRRIHSSNMSLLKRKQHMWSLRDMGYQVGAGFLVGMPYQTIEQVAEELIFIKNFGSNVVTVAPFLPAQNTPFERERGGNGEMVLYVMSILRLMMPSGLIVADLGLEQALLDGRKRALSAGANIIVTDISTEEIATRYQVYNHRPGKRGLDERLLVSQIRAEGYRVETTG